MLALFARIPRTQPDDWSGPTQETGFTSTATSTSCSPPPSSTPLTGLTSWKSRPKAMAICSSFGMRLLVGSKSIQPHSGDQTEIQAWEASAPTARLPLWRVGQKIAADIARGEAERAQAGDFEMGEILADAAPDAKHLFHRGRRVGSAALEFELAIDFRG